jgi:hypothetical protein
MNRGSGNHVCLAGCGKAITWRFAICRECEKKYGSKPSQWPDWLQYLWTDTQRERRDVAAQVIFETGFMDEEFSEDKNGKVKRHNPSD